MFFCSKLIAYLNLFTVTSAVPAPSAPSVLGPTLALPLPLPLPLPLSLPLALVVALALHMNGEKWFSKQVD